MGGRGKISMESISRIGRICNDRSKAGTLPAIFTEKDGSGQAGRIREKPEDINPMLFPWQRDIDSWALIGIELKPSYYQQAVNNCKNAVIEDQVSLFDGIQEG